MRYHDRVQSIGMRITEQGDRGTVPLHLVPAASGRDGAQRRGIERSDAALVVDAQGGSSWAIATLVRRHLARVQAFARMLLGPDAEIDDVVQEAFAQVVRSINKLKSPPAFGSWVFAIVGGTVGRALRHQRLLKRHGLGGGETLPVELESVSARTLSPEVAADLPTVLGAIA